MKKLIGIITILLIMFVSAVPVTAGLKADKNVVKHGDILTVRTLNSQTGQLGDIYLKYADPSGNLYRIPEEDGQWKPYLSNVSLDSNITLINFGIDSTLSGRFILYQIITVQGGDPDNVADWANGYNSFQRIQVYINENGLITHDEDGNGFSDDDRNHDGFHDDDVDHDGYHDDDEDHDGYHDDDEDHDGYHDDDEDHDGYHDDDEDHDGYHDDDEDRDGHHDDDGDDDGHDDDSEDGYHDDDDDEYYDDDDDRDGYHDEEDHDGYHDDDDDGDDDGHDDDSDDDGYHDDND